MKLFSFLSWIYCFSGGVSCRLLWPSVTVMNLSRDGTVSRWTVKYQTYRRSYFDHTGKTCTSWVKGEDNLWWRYLWVTISKCLCRSADDEYLSCAYQVVPEISRRGVVIHLRGTVGRWDNREPSGEEDHTVYRRLSFSTQSDSGTLTLLSSVNSSLESDGWAQRVRLSLPMVTLLIIWAMFVNC